MSLLPRSSALVAAHHPINDCAVHYSCRSAARCLQHSSSFWICVDSTSPLIGIRSVSDRHRRRQRRHRFSFTCVLIGSASASVLGIIRSASARHQRRQQRSQQSATIVSSISGARDHRICVGCVGSASEETAALAAVGDGRLKT